MARLGEGWAGQGIRVSSEGLGVLMVIPVVAEEEVLVGMDDVMIELWLLFGGDVSCTSVLKGLK